MASKHQTRKPVGPVPPPLAAGGRFLSRRQWMALAGGVCVAGAAGATLYLTRTTRSPGNGESPDSVMNPGQYQHRVVNIYPHDSQAFTQGLVFEGGVLYESTGLVGRSSLRKVELETGRVLQRVDVPMPFFAEGIALWGDDIIQLTWEHQVGIVYDRETFQEKRRFRYAGEGWGLTHDSRHLIMSDGTPTLRFLDPATYAVVRRVEVTDAGRPLKYINELEYVEGEILANIWYEDRIARIDPASGRVTGWVDLAGLLPSSQRRWEDVLNGIAYDRQRQRLFVTGKNWPKLFEIRIIPAG